MERHNGVPVWSTLSVLIVVFFATFMGVSDGPLETAIIGASIITAATFGMLAGSMAKEDE